MVVARFLLRTRFAAHLCPNSYPSPVPRGLSSILQASKGLRKFHGGDDSNSAESGDSRICQEDDKSLDSNDSKVTYTAFSKLKTSTRHDMAMVFTCKVCETRSVKTLCRESYEKGVVVARCGGCSNLHLIADHLGWFGNPVTVEDLLASRGEEVKRGSIDTLNLTLDDIVGTKSS